jgi:putative hemolysin
VANTKTIDEKAETGDRKAVLLNKILDNPANFDITMNVFIFMSTLVAGGYIVNAIAASIGHYIGVRLLVATVMLIIMLIFGLCIPYRLGKINAEKKALNLIKSVRIIMIVFTPIIFVTMSVSRLFLKMFGIKFKGDEDNVTEDEIITMVNEGQEQGLIEASEAEMINNIFELGDKNAGDIMTHRSNIEAVEQNATLDEFIRNNVDGKYSRFPVYDEDIDNIVGTIHLRDAIIAHRNTSNRKKKICDVKNLMRDAFFVPESRDINDLLNEMRDNKIHMGIVVDEYGQTAGIVSMEDILEEIVGNILDEYDEEEIIEQTENDTYVVDGLTELEDLNKLLNARIENENYDTLNGFLISKLGRIADEDEKEVVEAYGFRFHILEVTGNVIRKVEIIQIKQENNEEERQKDE